jgi:hypothetical protein
VLGPELAIRLLSVGALAQKLAEWRLGNKINKVDEKIRGASPLGRETKKQVVGTPKKPFITVPMLGQFVDESGGPPETIDQLQRRLGSQ